jgi:hypothetical protein
VAYAVEQIPVPVNSSALEFLAPGIPFHLYGAFPASTIAFFTTLFSDVGNVTNDRVQINSVIENLVTAPSGRRRRLLQTSQSLGVIVNGFIAPCPVNANGSVVCTSAQEALFRIIACFEQRQANCIGNNTQQALVQLQVLAAAANITINGTAALQGFQTISYTPLGCPSMVEFDPFTSTCDFDCYLATPHALGKGASSSLDWPQSSITLFRLPLAGQTLWSETTGTPTFFANGGATTSSSSFRFTFLASPSTAVVSGSVNASLPSIFLPSKSLSLPVWPLNDQVDVLFPGRYALLALPNAINGIYYTMPYGLGAAVAQLTTTSLAPVYNSWQMAVWLWMPSANPYSNIATAVLASSGGVTLSIDATNGIQCAAGSKAAQIPYAQIRNITQTWLLISCTLDVQSVASANLTATVYLHVALPNLTNLTSTFAKNATGAVLPLTTVASTTFGLYQSCATQGSPLGLYDCPLVTGVQVWGLNTLDTLAHGNLTVLDDAILNIYLTVMNLRGVANPFLTGIRPLNDVQGALCVDSLYGDVVGNPMVEFQDACQLNLGLPCQNGVCAKITAQADANTLLPFEDLWQCQCTSGYTGSVCQNAPTVPPTTTTAAPTTATTTTTTTTTTSAPTTTTTPAEGEQTWSGLTKTNLIVVIVMSFVGGTLIIGTAVVYFMFKDTPVLGYHAPRSIQMANRGLGDEILSQF